MSYRTTRPLGTGLILLTLMLSIACGRAQGDVEYKAYEVWARFLKCFADECTWPTNALAETNTAFVVGVFVPDRIVGAFHELETKRIKGRAVVVKQCHNLVEAKLCHMVFFSANEESIFVKIEVQLEEASVLTVGESDGFAHQVGIITLGVRENRKPGFKINDRAANHAGLRLSADLLAIH